MITIDDIKGAIGEAFTESRDLFPIDSVRHLTGNRNRHFLNAIASRADHYLEVGVYCGASFSAAIYKNQNLKMAIAIDSWAENFGGGAEPKKEFFEAMDKYLPPNFNWQLYQQNCWDVTELPVKPDVFYYDGAHDEKSQERALTHFGKMCADQFVYICDDYNPYSPHWQQVVRGTKKGLSGFNVLWEAEIISTGDSRPDWWNGMYVGLLSQK